MDEELKTYNGNAVLNFDFKAFIFRCFKYWKWFVLALIIGFYIVYQQNIRREFPYTLSASITVQDDKNPLFTSNTSLVFNYGGISGKVQDVLLSLKSRKHHEKVVDSLNLYLTYLKQDRFYKTDVYGSVPFEFLGTQNAFQITGLPIKIKFLTEHTFELSYNFEELNSVLLQNYETKTLKSLALKSSNFVKTFAVGELIDIPILKGVVKLKKDKSVILGSEYYIKYNNFNSAVSSFLSKFTVLNKAQSPLLQLRLTNKNKAKIVDYLNTSAFILERDQLKRKNQYAINTVAFIDKQLARVKAELNAKADSLNRFKQKNKIFDIDNESEVLFNKIEAYRKQKEELSEAILTYDILKDYLISNNDYSNLQVPSTNGIDEANIGSNVSRIIQLSAEKSKLSYSVRDNVAIFNDLDRQIQALKYVILENIASVKNNIGKRIQYLDSKISNSEFKFSNIPGNQQRLEGIERAYLLSQNTYDLYLAKRGEADLIKASNISDIILLEPAKDTGQGRNIVNLNVRYVFAFFAALIPFVLLAFVVTFFDNKFHSPSDVEKNTKIPLLGVVGENESETNLVVFDQSQSAIAESFRAIRSSLQFIYKKHDLSGSKTVMLTSSISGEGKTFCSINIASVFALSGKKTVLVGLDLRKPKIFDDFEISNAIGAVNYLIGQKKLEEVIQKTKVDDLDVITAGPVPPNPSELLMGETMHEFIKELKQTYDYIILDTPPLGLVADALELLDFVDASLYVVRQDYTKKDMLTLINKKYSNGEVKNISFLYNFYNQKGGYGYGYNYGYGYGSYNNGYHKPSKSEKSIFNKLRSFFKR